jgi:hypothetical protein
MFHDRIFISDRGPNLNSIFSVPHQSSRIPTSNKNTMKTKRPEEKACELIQRVYRGYRVRKQKSLLPLAVTALQALFRGYRTRKRYHKEQKAFLREEKRARESIQKHEATATYKESEYQVISHLDAKYITTYYHKLHHHAALKIQSNWRGYLARKQKLCLRNQRKQAEQKGQGKGDWEGAIRSLGLTPERQREYQTLILEKLDDFKMQWRHEFRSYQRCEEAGRHPFHMEYEKVVAQGQRCLDGYLKSKKSNSEVFAELLQCRQLQRDIESSCRLLIGTFEFLLLYRSCKTCSV